MRTRPEPKSEKPQESGWVGGQKRKPLSPNGDGGRELRRGGPTFINNENIINEWCISLGLFFEPTTNLRSVRTRSSYHHRLLFGISFYTLTVHTPPPLWRSSRSPPPETWGALQSGNRSIRPNKSPFGLTPNRKAKSHPPRQKWN